MANASDNKNNKSEPTKVQEDTRTRGREGSSKLGQDLVMPSKIKRSRPKATTNARLAQIHLRNDRFRDYKLQ